MLLSRFTFRRGDELFEVLVRKKWDTFSLQDVELINPHATPLFLEADDFTGGSDVFGLDFFLMKQSGEVLEGKDMFTSLDIPEQDLRSCLENEVRRLAARTRAAFLKEQVPTGQVLVTLQGIAAALESLNMSYPLPKADLAELQKYQGAFLPRKRSERLLVLFEKWEHFLEDTERTG